MDNSPVILALAILGLFAAVFPALWCLVLWFLSWLGGWQRLASQFLAADRPVTGRRKAWLYGKVGLVSYRRVLILHVAGDGFFLEVMALFRPGHPRLFVPWQAIRKRTRTQFLLWRAERIEIGHPPVAVTLPDGALPPEADLPASSDYQ